MAIITVGGNTIVKTITAKTHTIVKSITVGTPVKQVTGSFTLDNLPDVDIGSVADGDLLIYDSAKEKYTKVTVQTSNGVQKAFDDSAQTYTLSLDSGASVKLASLKIDSLTSDSATIAIGSNLSVNGDIAVTSGYTVSADSATFTRIRTANYALPINDAVQTGQALVSDGAGNVTFAFAGAEGGGITVTRMEQLSDVQTNLNLNKNPGTYLRWDSAFTTYDSDGQFTARIFNEDVRSALSAAGDITYDSATGRFSLNVETVYTAANFDSDFNISMDAAGLGGIGLSYTAGTNTLSIDSAQLYAYYNVDSASQATNSLTSDSATVSTTSLNTTGNAATATQLATARAIGGVNFDGTAAINLPGVNTAGNQNTSGNAATADSATISTLSLNTSGNAATADSATVATNALNTTGNAATADSATTATTSLLAGRASILATARTIGGVSFDGSAPIDLPGVNTAGNQSTSGTAAIATKLATTRAIGGVNFDGTGPIDLPGVNAAGNQNTSGNAATADSATVATNALNTTGNAATATQLATARTIGGVSFNGTTSINLPGVNIAGNQATSGLAATATLAANATKLATPRAIAGVNFDGTAPISLALTNLGITDGDSNQVLQADGDGTFSFVDATGGSSDAQIDSLAKSALIGLDAGGDGSFAYDSATGRFTYTGPNATEVRAHFTAGNNITIAGGKVSIDSNSSVIFSNVDADSGHIGNISSTSVLTHNLTVTGTQTVVDTTNLEVADPLIRLATGNDAADILDLGIIGKYYGGANREHTGIFRDASNSQWYLFDGLIDSQLDSAGGVNLVNRSGTGFVLSTLNAGTFVGALSGNATTATTLATTRAIGGVNFDGSAAINLPGVNAAGNQNTSGTAAIATAVTVSANDTENATMYPVFVDGATGTQGAETDTGLTYNPNSGILTATAFAGDGANLTGVTSYVQANFDSDFGQKTTANLSENTNLYYTDARVTSHVDSAYVNLRFAPVDGTSGMYLKTDGSGNHTFDSGSVASAVLADTATILATARTIGGVSFNGSAAINLPGVNIAGNQATSGLAATATKLATARAIGGVNFDGSSPINLPGVNIAGNQATSGTAAIATTVTMAATDTSTDAHFPLFSSAATGNEEPRTDTGLTYVPTSGTLTALVFAGALTGEASDIADNAVTLAKMAGGTDGNLISYDSAGDPVAVATGSAGQVLTSAGAGAAPSFAAAPSATVDRFIFSVSSSATSISGNDTAGNTLAYVAGFVDVWLNGVKMVNGTDVTVTSGNAIVFAVAIGTSGTDIVDVIAYGTFNIGSVTSSSLVSGSITTAKIADDAVTVDKLANTINAEITANTAKVTNATHTGEVTGATALTIADNVVDEANLKVSNAPTNGYMLTAQSGNTGGLTWAAAGGFSFNAVTGATPSLNLGSYNFFDRGLTSANTTVSFASVPTEANWKYTFEVGAGTETYEVDNASFEKSFSISALAGNVENIFFKPDGTEMYLIQAYPVYNINQFTLSTAWEVSTASYTRTISVSSQESAPTGLFFKDDGTEMYVCGSTGDDVNQYTLSTAWDISSATYTRVFSVATQDTSPQSLSFKSDGTEMYIMGYTGYDVNQYTLSTAWNISTASYTRNFSVSSQLTDPNGLFFKEDGTKMYITGNISDSIYQYTLSTGWDVSTASYAKSLYVGDEGSKPVGVFFKPDGSKMYVADDFTNAVHQYHMGILHTLTLPSSIENPPRIPLQFGSRYAYDFFTKDGGTTVTLLSENKSGTIF